MSDPVDEAPVVAAERERIRLALTGLLEREPDPARVKEWVQGAIDFNAPVEVSVGTPQEADGA